MNKANICLAGLMDRKSYVHTGVLPFSMRVQELSQEPTNGDKQAKLLKQLPSFETLLTLIRFCGANSFNRKKAFARLTADVDALDIAATKLAIV